MYDRERSRVLKLRKGARPRVPQMAIVPFDFSALNGYYQAKTALRVANSVPSTAFARPSADAASAVASSALPWRREPDLDALVRTSLGARSFIPARQATDAAADRSDVPKILLAYEALEKMKALADAVAGDTLPVGQAKRAQDRLNDGLNEVRGFLSSVDIRKTTLLLGEKLTRVESEVAIKRSSYEFTTRTLHEGAFDAEVAAFAGDRVFTIDVKKGGQFASLTVDLAEMGTTPRTLDAVAAFINTKLEAADVRTRFERTKIGVADKNGIIPGNEFGFRIKGQSNEVLTFSAPTSEPALLLTGNSGPAGDVAAQVSRWSGLDGPELSRTFTARLGADGAETVFSASALHPDGGFVAVGRTSGALNGETVRGDADAVLARYDGQGNLLWTRSLGASATAAGLAVAVSDTGSIALSGEVEGVLSGTSAGTGKDAFVTLYDGQGVEQFTHRVSGGGDDVARTVAFAPDGSLFLSGSTRDALGADENAGGAGSFIRKLAGDGTVLWTRQFGTAGTDRINTLTLDTDGALLVAGEENGEAIVRRMAGETADAGDWQVSLGNLQGGQVASLVRAGDGSLYLSGTTRATGQTAAGFSGPQQPDNDAFAARIDRSAAPSLDWLTRLGGEGDQTAPSLAVHNGDVLVAGSGTGMFGTASATGHTSAFVARLDAATGVQGETKALSGRAGISGFSGIVIDTRASETLDAFGLPGGKLTLADQTSLTERTGLRPGDHFYISVDKGREQKITIEQGETMRSLAFQINSALLLKGSGDVRRSAAGQSIAIAPGKGHTITLRAGAEGRDALGPLRMPEGVIIPTVLLKDRQADAPEVVSLGIAGSFSIADKESAEATSKSLDSALRALRTAYRWAIDDPTLTSLRNGNDGPGRNRSGAVPAYLNAQIANLQAGLSRLQAGQGSFFA